MQIAIRKLPVLPRYPDENSSAISGHLPASASLSSCLLHWIIAPMLLCWKYIFLFYSISIILFWYIYIFSCSACSVLPVLFCLSCSDCPVLPVPYSMSCLLVLFCLSRSACPVLPVRFYLSCFACLVLPLPFYHPVLPALFCLSCSWFLVLPVLFCTICSARPFLPVWFCLSSLGFLVLAFFLSLLLVMYKYKRTSVKGNCWARKYEREKQGAQNYEFEELVVRKREKSCLKKSAKGSRPEARKRKPK